MRAVINCMGFVPGSGGVDTYLRGLLQGLAFLPREWTFSVLCDEPARPFFESCGDHFQLESRPCQAGSLSDLVRTGVRALTGFDILTRDPLLRRADVVHHP
ncbi:MAG: hypothetical protein D6751_00600, partial [Deltaproteobacteria bacterium]